MVKKINTKENDELLRETFKEPAQGLREDALSRTCSWQTVKRAGIADWFRSILFTPNAKVVDKVETQIASYVTEQENNPSSSIKQLAATSKPRLDIDEPSMPIPSISGPGAS